MKEYLMCQGTGVFSNQEIAHIHKLGLSRVEDKIEYELEIIPSKSNYDPNHISFHENCYVKKEYNSNWSHVH